MYFYIKAAINEYSKYQIGLIKILVTSKIFFPLNYVVTTNVYFVIFFLIN